MRRCLPCYRWLHWLVFLWLLSACRGTLPPQEASVWIDVPADGFVSPVDRPILIEGRAAHQAGIARIEVWVRGDLHLIEENPPAEGDGVRFSQSWMPPGAGDYTIEVVAVAADGTISAPATVDVHVGEPATTVAPSPTAVPQATSLSSPTPTATPQATSTPMPTLTPTPRPTATPTPTPTPAATIQFWADAERIAAGSCTILHWHTENVQAVFIDGAGTPGIGDLRVCPCSDETHTLRIMLPDGSEELRSITIRVTGTCPTPTSEPDSTAPPAPGLVAPAEGTALACAARATLVWSAVSDPSGISAYRVQVESHTGDENWQPVGGSPWQNVSGTQLEIDVACGTYYRWRVQAVDGAGNAGAFSNWFAFSVTLA